MKFTFTLLFVIFYFNTESFSQHVDSLTKAEINYLKKQLSVSDSKAQQVLAIQQQYKASAKKVLSGSSVTGDEKKKKFQALIDDKNQKLKAILTEEQFKLIVPTTELARK